MTNCLEELKNIFKEAKQNVSDLQYTKNNYDNYGRLIKKRLPTITTDFCEIGLQGKLIYLVFIIKSETFNLQLFNKIKKRPNIAMYGFNNFKKNLYPDKNFDFKNFINKINEDKYLQIQFDFKNQTALKIFNEYAKILDILNESNVGIINQLHLHV